MSARQSQRRPSRAPELVRIPAGSFLMGSDSRSGQRAPHPPRLGRRIPAGRHARSRMQTTRVSSRDTELTPPPFWNDPNFNHPQQPVVAVSWLEAVKYCEWLTAALDAPFACPPKPNGSAPPAAESKGTTFPWGNDPPQSLPDYQAAGKQAPNRWRNTLPMPSVYMTSAKTCTNGAATGTTPTITRSRPTATPRPGEARRPPRNLPRRLLAPPHQSNPLRRPLQHPPRIPLRRLRIPRSM